MSVRGRPSEVTRHHPVERFTGAMATNLGSIGADIESALHDINVPSYVIDSSGVVRWLNPAAVRVVGDVRGRQFTSCVLPADMRVAREHFARKIAGTARATDGEVTLLGANGAELAVEISSVGLVSGDRVVGVFGQVVHVEKQAPDRFHPRLTARQSEVLAHLEQGKSTRQIADDLRLSPETVKNHVRHILDALGVHSRLAAVAAMRAHRAALAESI